MKLAQFKDLLKKKEKNDVDILTLPIHHPEEVDSIINHSIPMVVRRNDKKKNHGKKRITQQWIVKEDDHDTAIYGLHDRG